MKDEETKRDFIRFRAEGKSYRQIAEKLNISKSTCSEWEHSLADQIEELKMEALEELYTSYAMTKIARIKSLGALIDYIEMEREFCEKPLRVLPEDKLIELRLKCEKELQTLYTEPTDHREDNSLNGILEEYNRLYTDALKGLCSSSDVKARLSILDAKRDLLYKIASEETKEEEEGSFSMDLGYTSKLLRHEDEEES